MKRNKLLYNGKIYTQADNRKKADQVVDSMAVSGTNIVAAGKNLVKDSDFDKYQKIDLKGRTVIPGLVDAHTHFLFMAIALGNAKLDGIKSLDKCLTALKKYSGKLKKDEWVIGEGFSPDRWDKYILPDRYMLDKICGGRPAAIWSKDQHMMWANSKALEIAGISKKTREPQGGKIDRFENGEPTGILREIPGYFPVYKKIKKPSPAKMEQLYKKALKIAYAKGVTAVHSMDGPDALEFFRNLSIRGKLGLRINLYPPGAIIGDLKKSGIKFGYGNDYFRVSGLKMFADGALGSQTGLCFNKYIGSKDNYGIETAPTKELIRVIKAGAKLGLPCAIHAIGDKAVSNVIDAFEHQPSLKSGGRHRIEHLQMIRRKDIKRLKQNGIIASMQPSHCPSDIALIEKYWGRRGRNCYIFNTLSKSNIPLAFGSDTPIEPLDPLAGINDAVNRKSYINGRVFYPEEKISITEAVYNFTVGPAFAVNQEYERGFLLPGYKADFVILSDNIYKTAPSKLNRIRIKATFFDGHPVYTDGKIKLD